MGLPVSRIVASIAAAVVSVASAGEIVLPTYYPVPPAPVRLGDYLVGSVCTPSPVDCQVWAIDPVGHGSRPIFDLYAATSPNGAGVNFTRVGDKVMFVGGVMQILVSDGTTAGTHFVDKAIPQPREGSPAIAVNGAMVFLTWFSQKVDIGH